MALTPRGAKNKGSNFERELATHFNTTVYPHMVVPPVHRTPLSGSFSIHKGVGSADLTGLEDLWIEAKRTERLNVHDALAQAIRGSTAHGSNDMPVVISRRNQQKLEDSLCILRLSDFTTLYKGYLSAKENKGRSQTS